MFSSQKAGDNSHKTVKWSGIQNTLEEAEFNVLVILECCASLSTSPESHGILECLAASTFELQSSSNEFSSVLLDELMVLASYSHPFTIAKLYNRMLQNMQRRWHVAQGSLVTPVHIRKLEEEKPLQDIILSPVGIIQQPMLQQIGMTTTTNLISRVSSSPSQSRFTIPFIGSGVGPEQVASIPELRNQDLPITSSTPVRERNDPGYWITPSDTDTSWRRSNSGCTTTSTTLAPATNPRGISVDNAGKQHPETKSFTPLRDVLPTTESNLNLEPFIPLKRKRGNAPSLPRTYQCTHISNNNFCSTELSTLTDWKRHEESHYPQKQWICLRNGADGRSPCTRKDHPFSRKDHLQQHLKMVHKEPRTNINSWYQTIKSDWKKRCGFCGAIFEDWDARCEHVGKHFQEEERVVPNWKDPWPGGDDEESPSSPGSGGGGKDKNDGGRRVGTTIEFSRETDGIIMTTTPHGEVVGSEMDLL